MRASPGRKRTGFESFYSLVVLFKGVDGLIELLLGAVVLLARDPVRQLVGSVATELAEGTSAFRLLLASWADAAADSTTGDLTPIALFLLVHGVVKLATVYCLLRRLLRFYPWAIGVLGALLIVQVTDALVAASVGSWVLSALDLVVLLLVGWEYRRLRAEAAAPAAVPAKVGIRA